MQQCLEIDSLHMNRSDLTFLLVVLKLIDHEVPCLKVKYEIR